MTHPSWEVKNLKRRIRKARQFPVNTCPASRHVQIMADRLTMKGGYPMLTEEPEHCAGSLYVTVIALYEARSALRTLAFAVRDKSPTAMKKAEKALKEHGWLSPPQPPRIQEDK